ncbi:MAG: TonB-dependent receptor [Halioglobus sp.]|nr:TonB-dependent receptor [Halioglobus sp.]
MRTRTRTPRGCWLAIALTGATGALAQQQTPASSAIDQAREETWSGGGLEEVIVTARRREESLQEVPVSVTAFSADQLTAAGIHSILDLEKSVPSLSISGDGAKTPKFFIRGIGQREGTTVFDPGVSVYLNEVLIPRPEAQLLQTVDIQSVQVLRGPQGTLFGKNTVGGAILFESRTPDLQEYGATVSGRVGNFGRRDWRVSGDIPLVENQMGLRLSVSRTEMEGFLENVVDGKKFGDEDRWGASGRFVWHVNDQLSADVFGFWSRIDERNMGGTCVFQNPDASLTNLLFPAQPDFEESCRESEALIDDREIAVNSEASEMRLDSSLLSVTLNWEISENLNFKSISSYGGWEDVSVNTESDHSRAAIVSSGTLAVKETLAGSGLPAEDEDRWQVTQEFQFNGTALNDRLQYTTGVFGAVEEINDHAGGQLVGPKGIGGASLAGLGGGGGNASENPRVAPFIEWLGVLNDIKNENVAFFGEFTYDFNEWLSLTAGGRYTIEKRERALTITEVDFDEMAERLDTSLLGDFDNVFVPIPKDQFDALFDDPRTLAVTNPVTFSDSDTFDEFTPSVTLRVLAPASWLENMRLDSFITYFTASRGFKAGGFDAKGQELVEVKPEFVDNFELGFKLDAVDNRVRINSAFYYANWKDMQIGVNELGDSVTGTEILQFMSNAGEATTKGVELETTFSFGNWFWQFNADYIDAGFDEFLTTVAIPGVGETTADRSREPLFMTPETTFSAAVQYNWNSPIGPIVPRLSYSYRDEVFTGMDFRAVDFESSTLDSRELLDARLTWLPVEGLRLTAYGNNLTDEVFFHSGFSNSNALGANLAIPGERRTYGLEVEWEFWKRGRRDYFLIPPSPLLLYFPTNSASPRRVVSTSGSSGMPKDLNSPGFGRRINLLGQKGLSTDFTRRIQHEYRKSHRNQCHIEFQFRGCNQERNGTCVKDAQEHQGRMGQGTEDLLRR